MNQLQHQSPQKNESVNQFCSPKVSFKKVFFNQDMCKIDVQPDEVVSQSHSPISFEINHQLNTSQLSIGQLSLNLSQMLLDSTLEEPCLDLLDDSSCSLIVSLEAKSEIQTQPNELNCLIH